MYITNKLDARARVLQAHTAIAANRHFCVFSGVTVCGKVEIRPGCGTASTDGWNVRYDPAFVEMLNTKELRYVVLHETMHKALMHLTVYRSLWEQDAELTNRAADLVINTMLDDEIERAMELERANGAASVEPFATMPSLGIKGDPQYRGWSVDRVFRHLRQQQQQQQQQPQSGDGEGFDSHDWENAADGVGDGTMPSVEERQQQLSEALASGESLRQRRVGEGSRSSVAAVTEMIAPKADWRRLLQQFLHQTVRGTSDATWRRPNRRFMSHDIYLPSLIGNNMGELVLGWDTSGSVFGGAEMQAFGSEVARIVRGLKPSVVHVIYWDTEVVEHQQFRDGRITLADLKPKGGGGTDGSALFHYLQHKRIKPAAVVQFTDGAVGDWGSSTVPTLWAITDEGTTAPWGRTVHITI